MNKIPKCKECKHLIEGISPHNNSRSNWRCELVRTECEPHRRIAQAKGDVIPIKTSPRWCPLRIVTVDVAAHTAA